nr:MAG: RNA-dependent RNA polymerase [Wufeng shrew phenuivirus 11]
MQNRMNRGFVETISKLTGRAVEVIYKGLRFPSRGEGPTIKINYDKLIFDNVSEDILRSLQRDYSAYKSNIEKKDIQYLKDMIKDIPNPYEKLIGALLGNLGSSVGREQLELFRNEASDRRLSLGTFFLIADIMKIEVKLITLFNRAVRFGFGGRIVNAYFLNNTVVISGRLELIKLRKEISLNNNFYKDEYGNWSISTDHYRTMSKALKIENMTPQKNVRLALLNKVMSGLFGSLAEEDLEEMLQLPEFKGRNSRDRVLDKLCRGFSIPLFKNEHGMIKDGKVIYSRFRGDLSRTSRAIYCSFALGTEIKETIDLYHSNEQSTMTIKGTKNQSIIKVLMQEQIFVDALEEIGSLKDLERIERNEHPKASSQFINFLVLRRLCRHAKCALSLGKVTGILRDGIQTAEYHTFILFSMDSDKLMNIGFKRDWDGKYYFCLLREGKSVVFSTMPVQSDVSIDINKIKTGGEGRLDKFILPPITPITIPEAKIYTIPGEMFHITESKIETHYAGYSVMGEIMINGIPYKFDKNIMDGDSLDKYPHDIVVEEWLQTTDVSFKEVGLGIGDHTDRLTPDYLSVTKREEEGIIEVRMLEVGTTRSTQLDKDYVNKREKYTDAINKRANKNVKFSYGILLVGPSSVLTNLAIDQTIATRMVGFFNFAWKIKKTAIDRQILAEFSSEEQGENKSIKQIFKNIEDFKGNDLLSLENYNEMISPLTSKDFSIINENVKKEMANIVTGYTDDNFLCVKRDCAISRRFQDQMTKYNESIARIKSIRDNYLERSEKAVVQLPLLNPRSEESYNRSLDGIPGSYDKDNQLSIIIGNILSNAIREGSKISELERVLLPPELQYELNKKTNDKGGSNMALKKEILGENYRKFGLSQPILTEQNWTYLRQRGVEGKKSYENNDATVLNYRQERKKWFTPSVMTDDIENFLKDPSLMDVNGDENYRRRISAKIRLINKGYNMNAKAEGSDKTKLLTETLLCTKLGTYCCFVADLGAELASSMVEGMKPGQFRVKKLPHWKDIFIITKSTGKTGVIFYSIVFKKGDENNIKNCFKKVSVLNDDWLCTDFVSDEKSSLDNKVKMESLFLNLASFWREHYYLPPTFDMTNKDEQKAFSMLKLSLLVALEDKSKTEEAITLTRYIHLESLVSWPSLKNPGKMLEKLNICCHSRLEVWLNKKSIEMCRYYISHDPFRLEDGQLLWDRFINPYSVLETEEYQTHEQVTNLMYIGYIKNKDQSGFANNSGQMISKIVEKEDQLRRKEDGSIDFKYLGLEEPGKDIGIHEFSPRFLKYLCYQGRLAICKSRGVDKNRYEDMLMDDIIVKLKSISVDSLATLKKSSQFGPKYYKYCEYRKKKIEKNKKIKKSRNKFDNIKDEAIENITTERDDGSYHRITNIEAIMKMIKYEFDDQKMPNIAYLVGKSLSKLENQSCLHIDIFKKNQHGGLREIYVMEIDARIVQRTIEEISRTIAYNFDSETMLHPSNKYIQPEREHMMCKRQFGDYVSYSTSDDAAKWSQCHIVTKFIIMLTHMTGRDFHPFIARSLSLWLDKKIKLNDELLDVFFRGKSVNFADVYLNQAYRAFNGTEKISWMKEGNSYVEISSGMMQGILHVTSSLLHVLFLDWFKRYCEGYIKGYLNSRMPSLQDLNRKLVRITYLVSSDDSSMTISYPTLPIPGFSSAAKILSSCIFELKTVLSKSLAIHRSIKSTSMTPNFYEFNSEFRFGSSEIKPFIKWVMASVQIVENESFLGIQEDFNSLLTKILEGGGSIFLTAMCQVSQALLNYRMLGEGLSVLWKVYADLMELDPDPTTGFFMMDPPLVPGMSGTKYQLWKTSCNTNMNVKFRYFLEESVRRLGQHVLEGTEFSGSLFSRTLFFSVGELIRYKRLLERIGFNSTSLKILEQEPIILYKPADTVKEIKVKIFAKARMPGISVSLSGTNTFVSKVASSIYLLSRTVCSCKSEVIRELIYNDEYIEKNPNVKISMLTYLTASSYETGKKIQDINIEPIKEILEQYHQLQPSGRVLSRSPNFIECAIDGAQRLLNRENPQLKRLLLDIFKDKINSDHMRLGLVSSIYKVNILRSDVKNYLKMKIDQIFISSVDSPCLLISLDKLDYSYSSDQVLEGFLKDKSIDMPVLSPAQRLYLFPLSVEYEDHERMISQYQISSELQQGRNIRLKTRLQQNLLWKSKDETPLLSVVQWKWFSIYKKSIDTMTLDRLFSEAQNMYQWLAEDPQLTLEQSHFSTQLEMFHFLSRDPIRSRSLRINSAFINPNNVTLDKVISRNFSNGLVPKIEKTTSYISKDYNRVVMHLLNCIHQFPLQEEIKIRNIVDLLIGGPTLMHTNEVRGKRINSLKLIQEALRENPNVTIKSFSPYASNLIPDIIFKNSNMENFYKFKSEIEKLWMEFNAIEDADEQDEFLENNWDDQDFILDFENSETFLKSYITKKIGDAPPTLSNFQGKSGYFQILYEPEITTEEMNNKVATFAMNFPKFINEVKQRSVGIFGFYEKAQKYENDRYIGKGIWVGNIGGVDVKIHINSDNDGTTVLETVIVKSQYYAGFYNLLSTWCRDHNVVVKTGTWSEGSCIDRIDANFRQVRPNSNQGCRIIKNDRIESIENFEYRTMQLELSPTGLRLTVLASINGKDQPVTLLSCNLLQEHKQYLTDRVSINEDIVQYKRYSEEFKAFINYQSYSKILNLIEYILEDDNTAYSKSNFIKWSSKLLSNSLLQKANIITSGEIEKIEDDSLDPDFQIEFKDEDFNIEQWKRVQETSQEIPLDNDYISSLEDGFLPRQERVDEELMVHPFFQSLLEYIPSSDINTIMKIRKEDRTVAKVSGETYRIREILAETLDVSIDRIVPNPRYNFDDHLM